MRYYKLLYDAKNNRMVRDTTPDHEGKVGIELPEYNKDYNRIQWKYAWESHGGVLSSYDFYKDDIIPYFGTGLPETVSSPRSITDNDRYLFLSDALMTYNTVYVSDSLAGGFYYIKMVYLNEYLDTWYMRDDPYRTYDSNNNPVDVLPRYKLNGYSKMFGSKKELNDWLRVLADYYAEGWTAMVMIRNEELMKKL